MAGKKGVMFGVPAPVFNSETAREAQKKSVAARKANKEARERLQLTAAELKLDIEAVMEQHDISALGVLKMSMVKAIQEGDYELAAEYAKTLAEFEAPKLARREVIETEMSTEDLTDEELDAKLRELGLRK